MKQTFLVIYLALAVAAIGGFLFGFVTSTALIIGSAEQVFEKIQIENLNLQFNQTEFQDFLNQTIQDQTRELTRGIEK